MNLAESTKSKLPIIIFKTSVGKEGSTKIQNQHNKEQRMKYIRIVMNKIKMMQYYEQVTVNKFRQTKVDFSNS